MKPEVVIAEDKLHAGEWRVEAFTPEADGECYVAIFAGPDSEQRAREYADWKYATSLSAAA